MPDPPTLSGAFVHYRGDYMRPDTACEMAAALEEHAHILRDLAARVRCAREDDVAKRRDAIAEALRLYPDAYEANGSVVRVVYDVRGYELLDILTGRVSALHTLPPGGLWARAHGERIAHHLSRGSTVADCGRWLSVSAARPPRPTAKRCPVCERIEAERAGGGGA